MTNTEFVNLTNELLRYNYRISGSDRRIFLKTIKEVPGALEQAKAFFGDRGSYYVSSRDLNRFVKDMNQGRTADSRNYGKNYKSLAGVSEVRETRQFIKNSKGSK